jgi:hypothetical protein
MRVIRPQKCSQAGCGGNALCSRPNLKLPQLDDQEASQCCPWSFNLILAGGPISVDFTLGLDYFRWDLGAKG